MKPRRRKKTRKRAQSSLPWDWELKYCFLSRLQPTLCSEVFEGLQLTHIWQLCYVFCYWVRRAALKKTDCACKRPDVTFAIQGCGRGSARTLTTRVGSGNAECAQRSHSLPSQLFIRVVFNSRVGASHSCCFQLNLNFFMLFSTQLRHSVDAGSSCGFQLYRRTSSCSVQLSRRTSSVVQLSRHTSSWGFSTQPLRFIGTCIGFAIVFCFSLFELYKKFRPQIRADFPT